MPRIRKAAASRAAKATYVRAGGLTKTDTVRLRGARVLGLQSRRTAQLVRQVQAGLPIKHLARLEAQSGLSREVIAQWVAISPRTLARRQREGQLNPEESDRLLRASRIFEMAVELFEGDVAQARTWLQAPNPALGAVSPLEFAVTEIGAREVENLIGRLEHGVFT